MKQSNRVVLITLVAFSIYFIVDELFFKTIRAFIYEICKQIGVSHIVAYFIVGIPILIGTILIHRNNKVLHALGLDKGLGRGILFPLVCTLPMFIGYACLFDYNTGFSLNTFLIGVIAAAFFEEVFFRGFLFGQLYRNTTWGFIPSIILGALLFGLIHLYQGSGWDELMGIFLITFLGSFLFGWVYVEWDYNLWIPIFLHLFMNLFWELFSAGENALGGMYSNIFRAITITLAIVLTLRYKRSRNEELRVNTGTLWRS